MELALTIMTWVLCITGGCFLLMISVLFLDRAYYYGTELWKVVKADHEKRQKWKTTKKFIKKL